MGVKLKKSAVIRLCNLELLTSDREPRPRKVVSPEGPSVNKPEKIKMFFFSVNQ
jgi:hypothetical protein